MMQFASTRLVAADIKAMVSFYEMVTGQPAEWLAPVFAEIVTPSATLAAAEPLEVPAMPGRPPLVAGDAGRRVDADRGRAPARARAARRSDPVTVRACRG